MDSNDEPRLLGTLEGLFPWGLVLVAAEGSSERIHEWLPGDQVTAGRTALVVKVRMRPKDRSQSTSIGGSAIFEVSLPSEA